MKVNGILNINKPAGISSHDVVDIIQKIFLGSKVGHTGTLDPIATGVLPILLGDATKLSKRFRLENKAYRVKMLLGVETDTYDITGKIISAEVVNKDEIYIGERIKRFIGKSMQKPPIYSLVKLEGKKADDDINDNKKVDVEKREIEIFDINNISVDLKKREVVFDVYCTKDTHIRTLIYDIGKKIGCGATMVDLIRLKSGDFDICKSIDLYEFLTLNLEKMKLEIISIEDYYFDLKKIYLNEEEEKLFLNGNSKEYLEQDKLVKVYGKNRYIGLGEIKDKKFKRYVIQSD